jgi:hypothetical protein
VIRTTVETNRADNELFRCVSGESRPLPIGPLPSGFTSAACHGANSRSAPVTPPSLRRARGGSPGEPGGERLVRGVICEVSKSGLKAHRAASPLIRHCGTGRLVIDTILGCHSGHPRRRRHREHQRRKARFSTPSNQEPTPGSPGETALSRRKTLAGGHHV